MISSLIRLCKNNIQTNQTLVLSFILFIGVYFYNLNISLLEIIITFFTVIILDYLLYYKSTGKYVFPYSGVNAGFWICFFLRSEDLIIYLFAWLLAIVWKYIFITAKWKHFMNPSNMWVFLTLILFPQYAWVNTLQWWNYSGVLSNVYVWALICVCILWVFMALRVAKKFNYHYLFDYIFPFVLLHSILFFVIPFHENIHGYREFFSISFVIFTFFMITDPKTVPKVSFSRILYACSLVLSFYILQFFINESYALLWSLFFNTLLLPYIWSLEGEYNKKKSRTIFGFYLILILFEILFIGYLIMKYWQPDLLFDNVCGQLFCN